jgi:hypothetical protein
MNKHGAALAPPAPGHPVSVPDDPVLDDPAHWGLVELVCANPGLLRVEFDALIAANVPPADGRRSRRPPRRMGPVATGRQRPAAPASPRPAVHGRLVGAPPRVVKDRRARERSPPTSAPACEPRQNEPQTRRTAGGADPAGR